MFNNLPPLAGPVDASGEPELNIAPIEFWLNEPTKHAKTVFRIVAEQHIAELLAEVKRLRAAAVPSSPAQEHGHRFKYQIALRAMVCRCGFKIYEDEPVNCAALQPSSPVADVEVIVNGQPVVVTAGTVRAVIEEAIRRSGQIGAPVAQWELRTTEGDIIPHNLTDGTDYELTPGRRLWLNLGAPSSPVAGSIHRLIEQWRASADWMMGSTKPDEWQRGGSGYLRKCADELEAALSAPSLSAGAAQKNEIKKI